MRRVALAVLLSIAAGAAVAPSPSQADTRPCGLPGASPIWIDYADATVPFWKKLFARPGLVVAVPGIGGQTVQLHAAGAATVYFDLKLRKSVGVPDAPADPSTIAAAADAIFANAVKSSGCTTPYIAENELFGAATITPWAGGNAQYRANVLALLARLAERGAHPILLIASPAYPGDAAGDWWRQVAQVADIVREFYPSSREVARQGALLGSRTLRVQMRQAIAALTAIGVPVSRLGLMLEFDPSAGQASRSGLAARDWFQVIKLEALSAKQVAAEVGISSVWSWGWATYNQAKSDPDKEAAACVYLWARGQDLCDGPAVAGSGFPASLSDGQIALAAGVACSLPGSVIGLANSSRLAAITGDAQLAASVLLSWAAGRSAAPVTAARVDTAEQGVIAERFGGSRGAYLGELAKARATRAIARSLLADRLRRADARAKLDVPAPSAPAVAAFYDTYAGVSARFVSTEKPVEWLGGRTSGVALETIAPARVFSLPVGSDAVVATAQGSVGVRPLAAPLPLGAFPLAAVRPAIIAALVQQARDVAYDGWLQGEMQKLQSQAICVGDDVPAAQPVDLTAFLPFLAL